MDKISHNRFIKYEHENLFHQNTKTFNRYDENMKYIKIQRLLLHVTK